MSGMDKLKQAWNENPIGVVIAAAGLLTGAGIASKRAYARRNRRRK